MFEKAIRVWDNRLSRCSWMLLVIVGFFCIGTSVGDFRMRKRLGRPILFWHPMKTGGSSVCMMAKVFEFSEEHLIKYQFDLNLNCKMSNPESHELRSHELTKKSMVNSTFDYGMFDFPVTRAGISSLLFVSGRNFCAYEPSYPPGQNWTFFNAKSLLSSDDVWSSYYHIMSLRHPVDRIFSHLFFMPYWKECTKVETIDDIVDVLITDTCWKHCNEDVCIKLQGMVEKFYVRHLSGTPANLTVAVTNLMKHIDLPFDYISFKSETMYLLRKSLHWPLKEEAMARSARNRTSNYQEDYPEAFAKLEKFVPDDMVIYDLAIEKFRRFFTHHGAQWSLSEKDEFHRYELFREWEQIVYANE